MGSSWGHLGPPRGHLVAILAIPGSSWVYLAPFQCYDFGRQTMHGRFCGLFGPSWRHFGVTLRPPWGHLGVILGLLSAVRPPWGHFWVALKPSRGDLGAILGHFEAILWLSWPSRGHLASILRHFSVTTSEDGRCIADFAKFAPRLHESTIFCFPRRNLWPLESILASF